MRVTDHALLSNAQVKAVVLWSVLAPNLLQATLLRGRAVAAGQEGGRLAG